MRVPSCLDKYTWYNFDNYGMTILGCNPLRRQHEISARFLAVYSHAVVMYPFKFCLADAANDIGQKLTYSSAACRVAMGTYPASKPGGGVIIKAGSISASFPVAGGAR